MKLDFIKDIVIAVVIAVCISFVIKPAIVKGDSMRPNFNDGDYLITTKIFSVDSLKKGDVVTFKFSDGRTFIKRVIGLPGDKIEVREGKVYVNGQEDDQSYTLDGITDENVDLTVPRDSVFCMGDNRLGSHDSRSKDVGCVSSDKLRWKVRMRVYPFQLY